MPHPAPSSHIATWLHALWSGKAQAGLAEVGLAEVGLAEVGLAEARLDLRARGRLVFAGWGRGAGLADALTVLVAQGRAAAQAAGHSPDTAIVTLPGPSLPLAREDLKRAQSDAFRGLFGLELRANGRRARLTPAEMLARNLGPNAARKRLARDLGLTDPVEAEAFSFSAETVLIDLKTGVGTGLFRGQPVIPQAAITGDTVTKMQAEMADWLVANVAPNGAAAYKYWPASGQYSLANNCIRQFMATACLGRLARAGHPGAADAAARNLSHNLRAFFRDEGAFGIIDEFGKVKLGAAAVALIAILDQPDPTPYLRERDRLAGFILSMQGPDGRFATFLRPEGRDDCQNFYPGEAMLALMRLHAVTGDARLSQAVARAFPPYRDWHLAAPNPAFVPWQAQALIRLAQVTGDPAPRAFAQAITRWLIGLQQGADQPVDVQGGFFTPKTPGFGPPHASAIGVYMEGIVEVMADARATGDDALAEACRLSLIRTARAIRQVQFRDGADMWAIAQRARVQGAVRTATHDSTIRIDNVQHALMALLRMTETFAPEDYRA